MRTITLLFILFFYQIPEGVAQVKQTIEPEYIRTIELKGSSSQSTLPVIELGQKLQLSFDDIIGNEADYFYTIEHFNFDWTPSDLSKGEYLDGFDDVRIETYENSFNTLQLYSNYKLSIPNRETRAIKKSGNYLLRIFNDRNLDHLVPAQVHRRPHRRAMAQNRLDEPSLQLLPRARKQRLENGSPPFRCPIRHGERASHFAENRTISLRPRIRGKYHGLARLLCCVLRC